MFKLWLKAYPLEKISFVLINMAKTSIIESPSSQLFERASRRNIKSHFHGFNIQWDFGHNWNTLLKYFSWSHFCEFFFVLFQALKVDVGVSRNNFFRSLEMLEMLENV